MADGGEDGVGGVADGALEIAAAKLGLHMADHGLNGAAASQFALDGAEQPPNVADGSKANETTLSDVRFTRNNGYWVAHSRLH